MPRGTKFKMLSLGLLFLGAVIVTANLAITESVQITAQRLDKSPLVWQKPGVSRYQVDDYLALVLERIWISEYAGRPTAPLRYFRLCDKFEKKIDGSAGDATQEILKHRESIWKFSCSPVVVIKNERQLNAPTAVTLKILDAPWLRKTLTAASHVIKSVHAQHYRLSMDRANSIVVQMQEFASRPLKGEHLRGFQYLDFYDLSPHVAKFIGDTFYRLQQTSLRNGEYTLTVDNGIATVVITTNPEFQRSWAWYGQRRRRR